MEAESSDNKIAITFCSNKSTNMLKIETSLPLSVSLSLSLKKHLLKTLLQY